MKVATVKTSHNVLRLGIISTAAGIATLAFSLAMIVNTISEEVKK